MWTIVSLSSEDGSKLESNMSDGLQVIGVQRGEIGTSYRLYIYDQGMLDLTTIPQQVDINGQKYSYTETALLNITIDTSNQTYTVTGDGNNIHGNLLEFPSISEQDLAAIEYMKQLQVIPYGSVGHGQRPYDEVEPIARPYFQFSPQHYNLGLCVYDWTTADFFRMDIFNFYRYTNIDSPLPQLSKDDIVRAIWTSNWPPYTPQNPTFMGSMLMKPATNESEVADQYDDVHVELAEILDRLQRVTTAALQCMPRCSVLSVPKLYSGQVDVSNLGSNALATYFEEFPGNAGPVGSPMGMPISDALQGFMSPGKTLTLKSIVSFTSSRKDACHYSNGIILEMDPPQDKAVWPVTPYLTPISNEADKDEYLFPAGSQWMVVSSETRMFRNKEHTVIVLKDLGVLPN